MKLSVIIPTHDRPALLVRLLGRLSAQTLPSTDFEIVVVDDGSRPAVGPTLAKLDFPFAPRLITQARSGAAAARHRGALEARGELLVFLDDDMQVDERFLSAHLAAHQGGERRVVLGWIRPDPGLSKMPLFERWHASLLEKKAARFMSARAAPKGCDLFTGNVSLPRAGYLAVGGFDTTLGQSEDVELGLRLEQAGLRFAFAPEAQSLHGSDHTDSLAWRARARRYGRFDHEIARRHRERRHASPWRFIADRPALGAVAAVSVASARLGSALGGLCLAAAHAVDALGFERVAISGTTLAYMAEYFAGLRGAAGGARACVRDLFDFWGRFEMTPRGRPWLDGPSAR